MCEVVSRKLDWIVASIGWIAFWSSIKSPRYDLNERSVVVLGMARVDRSSSSQRELSVLDHVSVGVTNIDRSRRFYDASLRPLGLVRIVDFGKDRGSDYGALPSSLGVEFTITKETKVKTPVPGAHLCFRAPDRRAVDAFYVAAIAAGGQDDGAPGLRPKYHANYYCAFVLDPDGHRIEAVCHAPERPVILAVG
jgi:catechol 2,3-dioxygenase-like lactoylglutathione lyase family enzyme